MTADPSEWNPAAETDKTPPTSEYGIISRLITWYGSTRNEVKELYPDDMDE